MAQYSVVRGRHLNNRNNLHEVVMIADKEGNIINTSDIILVDNE